ncbi:MAG TPA: S8 family serine peptidase [Candidatus Kapabacteria bacterium]|nr:S8 family serine peptidase [Candidatus Kapabacteria bacterium]
MSFRQILPAIAAAALFATGCDTSTTPTEPSTSPLETASLADESNTVTTTSRVIPGRYIVVLNNSVSAEKAGDLRAGLMKTAKVDRVYSHALQGFAGEISEADVARLRVDARVAYIEPDREINLVIAGKPSKPGNGGGGSTVQTTPWGITRVGGAGDGVGKVAWIIDTGIDLDHPDLTVDVTRSRTFVSGTNSADDGNGHGTHVAGTIAAENNTSGVVGVAAGATVVAIRVLSSSGSGTISGVVAGVDHVRANASAGDVANMSLGGSVSTTLDNAVAALGNAGIKVALAAGNEGDDAIFHSPARVNGTNIYTVSAIGSTNCLASWSNYGTPVDYAAPGVNILSTWRGGGTNTISGTSMAAPHVAGILLLGTINSDGTACNDPDSNPDPIAHR